MIRDRRRARTVVIMSYRLFCFAYAYRERAVLILKQEAPPKEEPREGELGRS